ncbi:MAG: ThiF family adenylyltransferase, partial [Phycisphaeraceae bacterium]
MKTTDELWRYHRQMLLGGVGEAGQGRLAGSRVVVVGCGALGCLSAEWLVRAGVGEVVVIDRDVVEVTNLQRQVLFDEADAAEGLPKAEAARRRLGAINGSVRVEGVVADVTAGNVERLLGLVGEGRGVDVIVDGLDNFETRYLLNDVALKHGVAYVYGGAVGMTGAVYPVLARTRGEDRAWEVAGVAGPDLEAIFPELPLPGSTATCDTAGVLGPVVGLVASVQAAETIKILTGQWGSVMRTMLHVDLRANRFRQVDVAALEEGVDGRGGHGGGGGRYRFLEGKGES